MVAVSKASVECECQPWSLLSDVALSLTSQSHISASLLSMDVLLEYGNSRFVLVA